MSSLLGGARGFRRFTTIRNHLEKTEKKPLQMVYLEGVRFWGLENPKKRLYKYAFGAYSSCSKYGFGAYRWACKYGFGAKDIVFRWPLPVRTSG